MNRKYLILILGAFAFHSMKAQDATQQKADTTVYDLSLEELMKFTVTTASKSKENVQTAPAIMNIVTSKDIETYGAVTLSDVLDRLTSVYLISSYFSPDGMLSMRGTQTGIYNTKVLILLDSRPLRESFNGGYNGIIYNMFPIERIERIEVIRGPGSVLYGTGAYVGVINIVTKSNTNGNVFASVRTGQFNTQQAQVSYGTQVGKLDVTAGLNVLKNDGWKFTARGESDVVRNKANTADSIFKNPQSIQRDVHGFSGTLKLKYKDFTLNTFGANNDWSTINRLPTWPNPLAYRISNDRYFTDLTYSKKISESWSTSVSATYNYLNYRAYNSTKADDYLRRRSSDVLLEFTNYFKPMDKLNLVVGGLANIQSGKGIDTGYSSTGSAVNIDTTPNANPWQAVPQYNYTWYAAYAQGDYTPVKQVKLVAGAQLNKIDGIDASISPRLGVILSANDNLGLKLLYGNAFRSPSAFERYGLSPNSVAGSQLLTPEKMTTYETQLFYNSKNFGLTATYFYNHDDNNITRKNFNQTINGVNFTQVYINSGYLNIQGLEFEGKANLGDLNITGSFTYQTSEDDLNQKDHTGIPQTMGKFGAVYSIKKFVSIGIFDSYYGSTADYYLRNANGIVLTKMANPSVQAYNFMNANVNFNLKEIVGGSKFPNLTLNLFVNNLLDEQIYYPELSRTNINSLPGRPGRSLYGSVTVKF
jgi:outer membrane receptor for ferrienterochelin and colicin